MKRRYRAMVLLATIAVCCSAFTQEAPMFRGGLQHTGVYTAAGIAALHGIKWKFHTAGRVISSPAVVSGVAYVGSTDNNLYAVDADTGALKWKFATQSWVTWSPAVAARTVFFSSYDSNFYAVDADTGKLKWKFQTGGEKRYAGKISIIWSPRPRACPTRGTFTCLPQVCGTARCSLAAVMEASTPWTLIPAS